MKILKFAILAFLMLQIQLSYSQNTSTDSTEKNDLIFDEVVISANKIEESKKMVSQQIQSLSIKQIESSQSQSTADLLSNSGNVFVQKSQSGGGSPVIRGFEANRIVLVIDGVRMNNIIYRGGHLQNIITLDNNILDRVEVLFGPSSTIYGSDALGGVIYLRTKRPLLALVEKKPNIKINAFARYGSVNNENTGHLDFNIGGKKFASLTSITYSKFDHLKGGSNQNPFYDERYGERPYYVDRISGKDSLVKNGNPYLQTQSGYSKYDILQKFLYQQNENLSHTINFQYANSTDIPRYDRLTDPSENGLVYAQWYYGPQERMLMAYDMNYKNENAFFQGIHFGVNYQNIEESRHSRKFDKNNLSHRTENVDVYGANLDFQKVINSHNIRFGSDAQFNTLQSIAHEENIVTGEISPLDTRYPDGNNTMLNAALYLSHTWKINEKLILTDGIRGGFVSLHSTFVDTSFYQFPYTQVDQFNPVFSASVGLISNPSDNWKLSLMVSSGFRAPNVDDLSKVFESAPGTVIVPNPDLRPEKTINYEASVTRNFDHKAIWENTVFYTQFLDAIVTDQFQFNGQDSMIYDGSMSQVLANQNKQKAYLYGFSSNFKSYIGKSFVVSLTINYTYGRIKIESSEYPLDHIPPLMMKFQITYKKHNFNSDFFVNYNGTKKLEDYHLNGEDNEQYATENGMPAWMTFNLRLSYKVHKLITLQAGIENILDTQYRTFASGINAPGRNIFGALRFHF